MALVEAPSVVVPLEAVASVVAEAPLEAAAQAEDFNKIKSTERRVPYFFIYIITSKVYTYS